MSFMRWAKNSFEMPNVWQKSAVSMRPFSSFITTMMSYDGWLKTSSLPFRSRMTPREGNSTFFRNAFESALLR